MRADVYISNDSGGMSVLASSAVDLAITDAWRDPAAYAGTGDFILIALEGDDSFIARVVANEPLTSEEQSQWVCRVRTRLKVPCGRLLIAGGFDPRVLEAFKNEETDDTIREVAVPPGEYRVDVYTHAPTMTARVLRDRWDQKLGSWFRRDHAGKPFPSWVAAELERFAIENGEDPGHEKDWKNIKASVKSKRIAMDTATLDWVGYVIHLHGADTAELTQPDNGWFATDSDFRQPDHFPLGLPAVGAEDPEVRLMLRDILPRQQPKGRKQKATQGAAAASAKPRAPVLDLLGEPLAIQGGAVAIPVEKIDHVTRIAWFCDREIDAAVIVTLPSGAKWTPKVKPDTPAIVSTSGNRLEIGFPEQEGFLTLSWVKDLCRSLLKLPDGSVLDVCFADTGMREVTSGNHRWRGTVGKKKWNVTHALPALTRAAAQQALALVDELDAGKGIRVRNAAEAKALIESAKDDDFLSQVELVHRAGVLKLAKSKDAHAPYLARLVFRHRLRHTWDLTSDEAESAELQKIWDDAVASITESLTPALSALIAVSATGKFERTNLGRWKGVDAKRLKDFDRRFRALGFLPLGDVVFEFAPDIGVRAYGADAGTAYASLMWPKGGDPQVDVVTRFSDGSSVTTTSTPGARHDEAAKIFRGSFPGDPPDRLWARHQSAVKERSATGCAALPVEGTVEGFARAVDDFFERQRAAARRSSNT